MHKYSAAIVGVTGYAGRELELILEQHPQIRVNGRFASSSDPATGVEAFSIERVQDANPDVVVLATEHEFSLKVVPELLKTGKRVIDMSGAFRLKDAGLYPEWYGFEHSAPELLASAVYGLPEFFRHSIQSARLVANPGCYATAAILPLLPLYRAGAIDPACTIVVDGKSGVSGAGRKAKPETHFCEVSENLKAYGVLKHRHTPEMVSLLPGASLERFVFTPHLIPIRRGILNTIVLRQQDRASAAAILSDTYGGSDFVRIFAGHMPDIHEVVKTNYCHIGVATRGDTTVLVSVIDNLVKGAAGQAVQNLNLMLGLEAKTGLRA
jgi:N-acetyl-gamma-glutamyl-phosphate reductase